MPFYNNNSDNNNNDSNNHEQKSRPTAKTQVIIPFDTPPFTPQQQGIQTYNENNSFTTLDNSLISDFKNCEADDLFGPSVLYPADSTSNGSLDDDDDYNMASDVLDDDEIFMELDNTFSILDSASSIITPPPSPLLPISDSVAPTSLSTDFILFE
ncbi:unnamed protein product [Absidia cylindrospora]